MYFLWPHIFVNVHIPVLVSNKSKLLSNARQLGLLNNILMFEYCSSDQRQLRVTSTWVEVRRPWFVLGWVTTREDRALWTSGLKSVTDVPLSCWSGLDMIRTKMRVFNFAIETVTLKKLLNVLLNYWLKCVSLYRGLRLEVDSGAENVVSYICEYTLPVTIQYNKLIIIEIAFSKIQLIVRVGETTSKSCIVFFNVVTRLRFIFFRMLP